MSTTTSTPAAAATPSARIEAFAVVFGLVFTITYTLCDQANWPLFTFHPAVQRFGLGFQAPVGGEGPAVYWYGWLAMALVVSLVLGLAATALPEGAVRKIPAATLWLVPSLAFFILAWSLSLFYLR